MWIVFLISTFSIRQKGVDLRWVLSGFMKVMILCEGFKAITITITMITPVVVARGGRARSNPAKTTTALRDVS